jgi:hypothetical protein
LINEKNTTQGKKFSTRKQIGLRNYEACFVDIETCLKFQKYLAQTCEQNLESYGNRYAILAPDWSPEENKLFEDLAQKIPPDEVFKYKVTLFV